MEENPEIHPDTLIPIRLFCIVMPRLGRFSREREREREREKEREREREREQERERERERERDRDPGKFAPWGESH